ncbi:HAD hydrolase family protein [Enterococcus sp. AZ109]|uniref:HAD hydrolase family protein n=1 Tax=Enterococcus sp. AZ109 TaxID=2774634 RepID=UPI003F218D82
MVPSAQLALTLLQEAGHFVSIATGRAHYKAKPFMESIGLANMVCSGGAGIVVGGELIENTPLDLEKPIAILREAESLGYGTLVMIDDSEKVYAKDDHFREQVGERKEPTTYVIDPAFNIEELTAIYKFFISIPLEKEEKLILKNTLSHLRFEPQYLMFQYDQKDQGLKK